MWSKHIYLIQIEGVSTTRAINFFNMLRFKIYRKFKLLLWIYAPSDRSWTLHVGRDAAEGASVRTASGKSCAPALLACERAHISSTCATCTVYLNHRQQFQHVHGNQQTNGHWTLASEQDRQGRVGRGAWLALSLSVPSPLVWLLTFNEIS